ncbi:MAG TPA: tetratricopeptide repeat protein, partial [Vicinamibacterales bacterium]|nr:tetratricopeptide repeat protein [Vicinamibacterales bacterium]
MRKGSAVGGGRWAMVCALLAVGVILRAQDPTSSVQRPSPTFSKDLAPLFFDRCAQCHHPGGAAPFSLLTYDSARQHAAQIASLTRQRVMPPWRADSDYGGFVGQHPLTAAEIDRIGAWVSAGAPEGDPRDLPAAPVIAEGWELGKPDLVVSLPEPYTLRPDGTDVFHIFVIPLPIDRERFVRGLEFRPGNARVVHHANIRIDSTPASRELDAQDPGPGYEGVIAHTATYPDGHFLGWTPGQVAPLLPKGMAWRLEPHTDLVVEIHMQPSGKPEAVAPTIGLYFGSDPPERTPTMIRLGKQNIDIAPGDKAYTETDSFVVPVDVEVQAVQPHAHYRATDVTGTVTLPDGTSKTLIHIGQWDFRWQHVYRFVTPFTLPKGTKLSMRYIYDNSAGNPRNPTQPPRRVFWGQRSADEMGDLWVQVLTRNPHDLDTLADAYAPKMVSEDVVGYERELTLSPANIALHDSAALLYLQIKRPLDAVRHFEASLNLQPNSAPAHFNLGTALAIAGQNDRAIDEYRKALALRPDYAQAHNNLAGALVQQRKFADAVGEYEAAVKADPTYVDAYQNLARA